MIAYREIYDAYLVADEALSQKETSARASANRDRWGLKRQLNDQAYFIMLFAQLEDHINRLCLQLINRQKGLANWGTRRSWDIIDTNNFVERFPFMNKVALLTDKRTASYGNIKRLYQIRCNIAHGNIATVGSVNVLTEAGRIKELAKRLRD